MGDIFYYLLSEKSDELRFESSFSQSDICAFNSTNQWRRADPVSGRKVSSLQLHCPRAVWPPTACFGARKVTVRIRRYGGASSLITGRTDTECPSVEMNKSWPVIWREVSVDLYNFTDIYIVAKSVTVYGDTERVERGKRPLNSFLHLPPHWITAAPLSSDFRASPA